MRYMFTGLSGIMLFMVVLSTFSMGAALGAHIATNDTSNQTVENATAELGELPSKIENDTRQNISNPHVKEFYGNTASTLADYAVASAIYGVHVGYQHPVFAKVVVKLTPWLLVLSWVGYSYHILRRVDLL